MTSGQPHSLRRWECNFIFFCVLLVCECCIFCKVCLAFCFIDSLFCLFFFLTVLSEYSRLTVLWQFQVNICIHVSILPQTLLPSRLAHNTEQSSMCYRVTPCWLRILNTAVCTCVSLLPDYPFPIRTPNNRKLFSKSLSLFLFWKQLHLITIWASVVAQMIKNLPANVGGVRDTGLIPGSGRSPGEGNGNPL